MSRFVCGACGVGSTSLPMRKARNIPADCCIPTPYFIPHNNNNRNGNSNNSKLCSTCRSLHYRLKNQTQSSNPSKLQLPNPFISLHHLADISSYYPISSFSSPGIQLTPSPTLPPAPPLIFQSSLSSTSFAGCNTTLSFVASHSPSPSPSPSHCPSPSPSPVVSTSSSPSRSASPSHFSSISTVPPPFLNKGDIRSTTLSPSHNRFLNRLAARWRCISHELQTSSEDPKLTPDNTSTVHAELSLDAMLQILLFMVHFCPAPLRLDPLVDSLFDCGSGYGWCLLVAYAGLGMENVCGLELVKERAHTSMSHLGTILKEFGFDLSYGYRDPSIYPLDDEMKVKESKVSSLRNGKARSNASSPAPLDEQKNKVSSEEDCSTPSKSRLSPHCPIIKETLLLPQGIHVFDGDIGYHLISGALNKSSTEIIHRFRSATHLCFFDLCFSEQTLVLLAKELSQLNGKRWKLFTSMQKESVWKKFGLCGWQLWGCFRGLSFKGNQQSASVYMYVVHHHIVESRLPQFTEPKDTFSFASQHFGGLFTGSDRLQSIIEIYLERNGKNAANRL